MDSPLEEVQSEMIDTETEVAAGVKPPYIAFPTFVRMLNRLRDHGVPNVFDASYFGPTSGSTIALHRGTFRTMGLMDDDKRPTPLMRELAAADDDQRTQMLRDIGDQLYAEALQLGPQATSGELADVFRSQGISGATVQKAVSFFLAFADHVGYQLSPHIKPLRLTSSKGSTRRRRPPRSATSGRVVDQTHQEPMTLHKPVETLDAKKAQYIDLLMDLAKSGAKDGELADSLLDRIERSLNMASPPTTEP